jgi:hypothetical protein
MMDENKHMGYSGGIDGRGRRLNDQTLYSNSYELTTKDMDEMMEERRKREAAA